MDRKEAFIIYTSFFKPISLLSDKQLGRLFRAIFQYNLGEIVDVEDDIRMAFEFFKNQFEIDERRRQAKIDRDIENGRKGGNPNLKRGQSNPYYKKDKVCISQDNEGITKDNPGLSEITQDNPTLPTITQDKAINENINENINIKETTTSVVAKKSESKAAALAATNERKQEFYDSLIPYVDRYGKEMVRDFFGYWSEMNKSKTKMRFESEKTWETSLRLATWERRSNNATRKRETKQIEPTGYGEY